MSEPMEGQPAFSLWTRLDAVQRHPADHSWPAAWQNVLGTSNEEQTQEHLIELASLYREVVQQVRSTVSRPEHLLHHSPDWRHAVTLDSVIPNNAISASGFQLSPSATSALYTVAVVLDRTAPVPHSSDARRQSIAEALEDLRVALDEATGLPDELLVYVRSRVGDISRALNNYGLTGDLPLVEVADRLAGDPLAQPELWSKVTKSPVGQKFLKVVATVVIAAHGYAGFSGDIATSIENTQKVVEAIQEAAPKALTAAAPPRELEPGGRTPQLMPGPTDLATPEPPDPDGEDQPS